MKLSRSLETGDVLKTVLYQGRQYMRRNGKAGHRPETGAANPDRVSRPFCLKTHIILNKTNLLFNFHPGLIAFIQLVSEQGRELLRERPGRSVRPVDFVIDRVKGIKDEMRIDLVLQDFQLRAQLGSAPYRPTVSP